MAINNQSINTNIDKQDYSNPYNDALAKALGAGITNGVNSGLERSNAKAQASNQQNTEKLKDLLAGKAKEQDIKNATDLSDANSGRSVRVGETSIGVDPMAQMAKTNQKNNIAAVTGLQKTYNAGTKGLQDDMDAAQNVVSALNSNDNTSLGRARAGLLAMNGFKRFNEPEAMANAPDSAKSQITSMLNKYGIGTDDSGNLSDIQRQNMAQAVRDKLSEIKDRHNTLKQTALGQYAQNPGSDPSRLSDLQTTLGSPLDSHIASVASMVDKIAPPKSAQAPVQAQKPGLLSQAGSALASLFGGGGKTAMADAAPPAAAPSLQVDHVHSLAPAQMQAPAPFDPDQFLQSK